MPNFEPSSQVLNGENGLKEAKTEKNGEKRLTNLKKEKKDEKRPFKKGLERKKTGKERAV